MRPKRPVVHGIEWQAPDEVPGGVLPPEVTRRLHEKLREIDQAQGRARVRSWSYWVGR
jgi:hypothetical protein